MAVTEEQIAEFRALYTEEFGKGITVDEARAMIARLMTLYEILLRPLPRKQDHPLD